MLHFLENEGIYVSSGSACAKGQKSHVLNAMGLKRELADSALRISFSHENTLEEAEKFVEAVKRGTERIRRPSGLRR